MKKLILMLPIIIFCTNANAVICSNEICRNVNNGNIPAVQKAIKKSPKLINTKMKHNVSLLHIATLNKDSQMMKVLLDSKINKDAQDIGGATAMHIAARLSCIPCLEVLYNAKASIDIQDNEGLTPIMRAILMKNNRIIPSLLTFIPNCNIMSRAGYNLKTIRLNKLEKTVRKNIEQYLKTCQ